MKNLFKVIGIVLVIALIGIMIFQLVDTVTAINDIKKGIAYNQGQLDQIYSEMRDDEKAIADVYGTYVGGYAMGYRESLEKSSEIVHYIWAYREMDGTIVLNFDCENADYIVTLQPTNKSV